MFNKPNTQYNTKTTPLTISWQFYKWVKKEAVNLNATWHAVPTLALNRDCFVFTFQC